MGMLTIAQAIDIAIESVKKRDDLTPAKQKETLYLLNRVKKKDCYVRWTNESIIEYLQKWRDEHGRPPTTTNLREPGMPHAPTIQKHFDMDASVFLKQQFPELRPFHRIVVNDWGFTTDQDWLDCFREQFNKHLCQDMSSKKYDVLRDENTPAWSTIAKHCNIVSWLELMKRAGVEYPDRIETAKASNFKLHVNSPYLEKLEKLNEERRIQIDELCEIVDRIKV